MLQCRACLYSSSHPFGLTFDQTGLCSGCATHAEKTSLDWQGRLELLERLVAPYRGRKGNYDCVIPVRGTAEYFYVVDLVKNKLGLNPLLVAFNSQFNSNPGIQNVDLIRETFDCDIFVKTMSPPTYRKLIRQTLSGFGSVHWPYIAGHTVWPVRVAAAHGIPLVIWPFHQPTEQVGMYSYLDENEMTRRSRHEHDLMRTEPQDLVASESLITEDNILPLRYPSDRQIDDTGLRGIYLANYLPWDTRRYSEAMVEQYGAKAAICPGTFDTYDHVDNMVYMGVHDVIKRRKLGYGRVRDHLCREIRFRRMTRNQALDLEAFYSQQHSQELQDQFFEWLGISRRAFEWLMNHHFGPQRDKPPEPSHAPSSETEAFLRTYATNSRPQEQEERYILIGKGLSL